MCLLKVPDIPNNIVSCCCPPKRPLSCRSACTSVVAPCLLFALTSLVNYNSTGWFVGLVLCRRNCKNVAKCDCDLKHWYDELPVPAFLLSPSKGQDFHLFLDLHLDGCMSLTPLEVSCVCWGLTLNCLAWHRWILWILLRSLRTNHLTSSHAPHWNNNIELLNPPVILKMKLYHVASDHDSSWCLMTLESLFGLQFKVDCLCLGLLPATHQMVICH